MGMHIGPQLTLESRTDKYFAVGLGAPTSLLNLGPSQHRYTPLVRQSGR